MTLESVSWLRRSFTAREKAGLALEAARAYAHARWLLWRADLPTTVATLRSPAPRPTAASPEALRAGLRLGRVVSTILGRLPFDSRCLMRSLVLTSLLARRGIHAVLVVAVVAEPEFKAHAWVELGSLPLLEPEGPPFERLVEL